MTEFAQWSLQRQKQFWLRLARDLIGSWNLAAPKLSWLGYGSNAVFKVSADNGEFVLRLQSRGRVDFDFLQFRVDVVAAYRQQHRLEGARADRQR